MAGLLVAGGSTNVCNVGIRIIAKTFCSVQIIFED